MCLRLRSYLCLTKESELSTPAQGTAPISKAGKYLTALLEIGIFACGWGMRGQQPGYPTRRDGVVAAEALTSVSSSASVSLNEDSRSRTQNGGWTCVQLAWESKAGYASSRNRAPATRHSIEIA